MRSKLTSVSAVFVVRPTCPDIETVSSLLKALESRCADANVIAVANGVDSKTSVILNDMASSLNDLTIVYLNSEQHDDVARLVGLEQAIGDYILLCTPTAAEIEDLDVLLDAISEGFDVVVANRVGGPVATRSLLNRGLFFIFRGAFRVLTGTVYQKGPPSFRLFSRAAALYLITCDDAEVRIRADEVGAGFPAKFVTLPDAAVQLGPGIGLRDGISRAVRLLVTTSALPLRVASYLGLLGGILSASYMIYVIMIWLLKPDVAPGWTTLSLQISGMTFLFSLIFFLMAEYLVQIFATLPGRSRRSLIAREVTSQLSRRNSRLNVVDAHGEFQLGMPPELRGNSS